MPENENYIDERADTAVIGQAIDGSGTAVNALAKEALDSAYSPMSVNLFKAREFGTTVNAQFSSIDSDGNDVLDIPELLEFAGTTYGANSECARQLANDYQFLSQLSGAQDTVFDRNDLQALQSALTPRARKELEDRQPGHWAYEVASAIPGQPGKEQLAGAEEDYQNAKRNVDNLLLLAQMEYFRSRQDRTTEGAAPVENLPAPVHQLVSGFVRDNLSRLDSSRDKRLDKREMEDALETNFLTAEEKTIARQIMRSWDTIARLHSGDGKLDLSDAAAFASLSQRYDHNKRWAEHVMLSATDHFSEWDANNSGFLTFEELKTAREFADSDSASVIDTLMASFEKAVTIYKSIPDKTSKNHETRILEDGRMSLGNPRVLPKAYSRQDIEKFAQTTVDRDEAFAAIRQVLS